MNRIALFSAPLYAGIVLLAAAQVATSSRAADDENKKKPTGPLWTDPDAAKAEDPDFSLQGEYVIAVDHTEGRQGLQVAAQGDGNFLLATYQGGLPGAGWDGESPIYQALDTAGLNGFLGDREKWRRITRQSPTVGKKAPEGAVVLFDGKANDLMQAEIKDGLLWAGSQTTGEYGSFHMHAEFRLPYKPQTALSSQDRGNSGLYLQNRYEVQVLDTFGLVYDAELLGTVLKLQSDPKQWCGCLYKFKAADTPMALPPLTWQTYDIDFTAPTFDAAGEKTASARITVVHNGVKIHDNVELPKGTGAGGGREEVARGPILFQGHGNPTAFRNVWLVER